MPDVLTIAFMILQAVCSLVTVISGPIWPCFCKRKAHTNANTTDQENISPNLNRINMACENIEKIKNSVEEIRKLLQPQPQEGQDQDQGQQNQEDWGDQHSQRRWEINMTRKVSGSTRRWPSITEQNLGDWNSREDWDINKIKDGGIDKSGR